jgi:hypothetical protein
MRMLSCFTHQPMAAAPEHCHDIWEIIYNGDYLRRLRFAEAPHRGPWEKVIHGKFQPPRVFAKAKIHHLAVMDFELGKGLTLSRFRSSG